MWYGLKVDGRIVAVKWFKREPETYEFGADLPKNGEISLVIVRVREVSVVP